MDLIVTERATNAQIWAQNHPARKLPKASDSQVQLFFHSTKWFPILLPHRKPKFTMVTLKPLRKLNYIDYFLFKRAEKYLIQCISQPLEEKFRESGKFSHLKWVISWGHGFSLNCLEKSDGRSPAESWLEVIHCERSDHLIGPLLKSVSCFKLHLRFLFPQGYLMNGNRSTEPKESGKTYFWVSMVISDN